MYVFEASRWSDGNVLFPASIILDDYGLTIRKPDVITKNDVFIPYGEISAVRIETLRVGFCTIVFYARGSSISAHDAEYRVHGFLAKDARMIQALVYSSR